MSLLQLEQAHRIYRNGTVASHPMKVRPGHAAGPAHGADPLPRKHCLATPHVGPAEMEVRRNQPRAMIDVDGAPSQIEVRNQRHHSSSGRPHRSADSTREVSAEMPALDLTIEDPGRAERTGNAARPGEPALSTAVGTCRGTSAR